MHVWTGLTESIYTRAGTLHGADLGHIMTELLSYWPNVTILSRIMD